MQAHDEDQTQGTDMYVPDQEMTTAYREAIIALGFAPAHADLVQVDVTDRSSARADLPAYRITTGLEVVRAGRTIRRALMLWYVYDRTSVLEETYDRDAIAAMIVETLTYLPATTRTALPAAPAWAGTGSTAAAARKAA